MNKLEDTEELKKMITVKKQFIYLLIIRKESLFFSNLNFYV